MVNLEIGRGTSVDDFSAIDWSMGPYFSKVELDPNGGIDYGVMGTPQFLSVPYAFYAKSSGDLRFPPLPNDAYVGVLCHNGLALNLVEVAPMTDADGDGDDDPAAFTLFATDFLARPITQDIVYSINRVGETPASNSQSITVTCDDDTLLMIEIHCWDGMVDLGYCETYVLVQDPNSHCH